MISKLCLVAFTLTFICISAKPSNPGDSFRQLDNPLLKRCGPDPDGCSAHRAFCHEAVMKEHCPATCGQCKRGYEDDLQARIIYCPCWWKGCFWGQYPNHC
ncbi:hypothetical protein P5673_018598 [Acropora cervicornis]|uniref:ShKT domain-containing protein n=1 Tax=Acropora cervicornis TaxID=6130 RepID=A0AAD9QDP1_ACRCE|nr:hypothetical protein P5673_018598 [Acropora cervicornis]